MRPVSRARPAMPDERRLLEPIDLEAEPPHRLEVGIDEVNPMHLPECPGLQHLRAPAVQKPELPRRKPGEILRGGGIAHGGSDTLPEEERNRIAPARPGQSAVAGCEALSTLGFGHLGRRARELQGAEEVLRHIVGVRDPGRGGHDLARERQAEVGILKIGLRRVKSLLSGDPLDDLIVGRKRECGAGPVRQVSFARNSGRVREQPLDRDFRPVGASGLHREPGQPRAHGVVEPKRARVPKLHHGDAREEFRDGADAVDRVRRGRATAREIGQAEAAGPQDLLIVNDGRGDARNLLVRALGVQPGARELERRRDARVVCNRGLGGPDGQGRDKQNAEG